MTIQKTELMIQFEAETGKNAIWNGKTTKNFKNWAEKRKKTGKKIAESRTIQSRSSSDTLSSLQMITNKFREFENRLIKLENAVFKLKPREKFQEVTEQQFLRTINTAYNSLEKRFGDFVSISALTNRIQNFLPWSKDKIHNELYKLFMEYKVDLQPGKRVEGDPLIKDGQTYVWFKLK